MSRSAPRAGHVLVLTLVFPPEEVSTSQLLGDLVSDLVSQGRSVTVITTKPHYHASDAARQRATLRPVWAGLLARSEFAGATVYHTAMPLKAGGLWRRAAGWVGFHVLSVMAALLRVRAPHVILAPSPPLTIGVAAWIIARLRGVPFIYNVQELYPDTAVALGALRRGLALNALYAVERFVYARAHAVAVIAPGMRRRLMAKGVPAAKVRVIPNFVDTAAIAERARDNPFAREHGLVGRFVIMYAGNVGRAQGLEVLLNAAARTVDREHIVYVIVGDGALREELMAGASARELRNMLFVAQQPYGRVPDIYGASDVNVVPLVGALVEDAVPSKVYRIMAARRAVLAIAAPESDLAKIVSDAACGWVVPPGNADALAELVLRLADEGVGKAGDNGRRYVEGHVERSMVTGRYGMLLDEAAGG